MATHGRRNFLKAMAGGAVAAAAGGAWPALAQGGKGKPNIVVIVSDDQGYGDSSCYKHPPAVRTPHIDRLAKSGVRLTNGYASGWVCAPTRAGLLTGRYQQRFGFYAAGDSRAGLPTDEITVADVLKKAGYATGVFGKWHVGLEREHHPLRRGFDEFYGFLGHGAHDYFDLTAKDDQPYNAIQRNDKIVNDTGYLTDNLAREAVAFIERRRREPFLLYLPFNAVHWPLQAPEADIKRYDTGDKNRDILLAMLRRMDEAVGAVLDALKTHGVADNTLIVFFSDNGGAQKNFSNNGDLRDFKQSVYEGGIRVPFIVSWPGRLPAGTTCDEPVISLDVMPTVCAAAGAPLPADRVYDGKNMLPHLRGEAKAPLHQALFWDGAETQWGVRMGNWKLLKNRQEKVELYDLEADLSETKNLLAEQPAVAQRLQQTYDAWKKEMAPQLQKKRTGQARNKLTREEREK